MMMVVVVVMMMAVVFCVDRIMCTIPPYTCITYNIIHY